MIIPNYKNCRKNYAHLLQKEPSIYYYKKFELLNYWDMISTLKFACNP